MLLSFMTHKEGMHNYSKKKKQASKQTNKMADSLQWITKTQACMGMGKIRGHIKNYQQPFLLHFVNIDYLVGMLKSSKFYTGLLHRDLNS